MSFWAERLVTITKHTVDCFDYYHITARVSVPVPNYLTAGDEVLPWPVPLHLVPYNHEGRRRLHVQQIVPAISPWMDDPYNYS